MRHRFCEVMGLSFLFFLWFPLCRGEAVFWSLLCTATFVIRFPVVGLFFLLSAFLRSRFTQSDLILAVIFFVFGKKLIFLWLLFYCLYQCRASMIAPLRDRDGWLIWLCYTITSWLPGFAVAPGFHPSIWLPGIFAAQSLGIIAFLR